MMIWSLTGELGVKCCLLFRIPWVEDIDLTAAA